MGRSRKKLVPWLGAPVLAVAVAFAFRPTEAVLRGDPLLVDDPAILSQLETRGLSFEKVVGRAGLRVLRRTVESDIEELTAGEPASSPRRPFRPEWLSRGTFELVGVVDRIDRRRFDPATCGEVRLVYRLGLANDGRPRTRLPMTVNVRIPQPMPRGERDCRKVAERWLARPAVDALVSDLLPAAELEMNYQSVHVPSSREDMDDRAEYVLRAFRVEGRSLRPSGLFGTPRADLGPEDRAALVAWVGEHLREIDEGSAVLPERFLATRIVSVSPRELVHADNRPFTELLRAARADLAKLPLGSLALARTPELLLRRLDESTCAGCHQTRGVAGFHLLGEERDAKATFNALAVGHSPHLGADLAWRKSDLASAARGERPPARPFAAYPDGAPGSQCGLVPGLAAWTCNAGLVCRDIHHGDVGVCAPASGAAPGDPCQDVTVEPSTRPEGPFVRGGAPDDTCPAPVGAQRTGRFCAPNWLGFTGGMCSERCDHVGEVVGSAICAPLPAAGYEAECFTSAEPIESCLSRHFVTALVASCDATRPCRDDYGCARVPGAPAGVGACVPPYFVFQARVDGPLLDR